MARTPTARKRRPAKAARKKSKRTGKTVAKAGLTVTEVAELGELRRELERVAGAKPPRWNADPDDVQRSVAQLVLTLVEFRKRFAILRADSASRSTTSTWIWGQ